MYAMKTCIRSIATALFSALAVLAQWSPDGGANQRVQRREAAVLVRGQLTSTTALPPSLTVELLPDGSGMPENVRVAGDGSFEFRSVTTGIYELRVVGRGGHLLHEETVSIGDRNQQFSVSMPAIPDARGSAAPTVSLRELRHHVPAAAQKAYDKGRTAAGRGERNQAILCFRRALTLDPEFADAYNDLGAAYLLRGENSVAAEQFQKTIELEPEHRLALANLSIALIRMNRYSEAGEAARRAIKADPGNARGHLILAASLMAQGIDDEEALSHLQRASADIPKAHLLAAELLARTARRQEAVIQLEQYLRVAPPRAAERAQAEAWLANLQRESTR
jgi:predicted Zn-dependent protease